MASAARPTPQPVSVIAPAIKLHQTAADCARITSPLTASVDGWSPDSRGLTNPSALVGAMGESGEGKVTPLELFADGILELKPEIQELIRAAA